MKFNLGLYQLDIFNIPHWVNFGHFYTSFHKCCRGPNASNPARGRTLPGQERPSNGRPDASQRRPGSMLCPVGLPGALSVDILALLLYWPTYAPITVRLTSDTHVAYWQWRPELPLNVWATCRCSLNWRLIFWGATAMHYLMHRFGIF